MLYLVVGDSITNPGASAEREPWTSILERDLNARAPGANRIEPFLLWPVGERAASYALDRVREMQPDGVFVVVNSYPCAVRLVTEAVRRRFGDRAYRTSQRFERFVGRPAERGPVGRPAASMVRRATRKVVSPAPIAPVEAVSRVYCDILDGLARLEGPQVFVLGPARYGSAVRAANPDLDRVIDALQAPVKRLARERRMTFVDLEPAVRAEGDAAWMPDHVHLSRRGNEVYASAIRTAIR